MMSHFSIGRINRFKPFFSIGIPGSYACYRQKLSDSKGGTSKIDGSFFKGKKLINFRSKADLFEALGGRYGIKMLTPLLERDLRESKKPEFPVEDLQPWSFLKINRSRLEFLQLPENTPIEILRQPKEEVPLILWTYLGEGLEDISDPKLASIIGGLNYDEVLDILSLKRSALERFRELIVKESRRSYRSESWEERMLKVGEELKETGFYLEAQRTYRAILKQIKNEKKLALELEGLIRMCKKREGMIKAKKVVEELVNIEDETQRARVLGQKLKDLEPREAARLLQAISRGFLEDLFKGCGKALGGLEREKYMEEVIRTVGYEKMGSIIKVMVRVEEYRYLASSLILFKVRPEEAKKILSKIKREISLIFLDAAEKKYKGPLGVKAREVRKLLNSKI